MVMGLVLAISLYALTYLHQESLHSTKSKILTSLGGQLSRIESKVSKQSSAHTNDHPLHTEEPKSDSEGGANCPESMKGIYSQVFQHLLRRWGPVRIGKMDSEELIPWGRHLQAHAVELSAD